MQTAERGLEACAVQHPFSCTFSAITITIEETIFRAWVLTFPKALFHSIMFEGAFEFGNVLWICLFSVPCTRFRMILTTPFHTFYKTHL